MQAKRQTNWTKCSLCQEDNTETLTSPENNPVKKDNYSNLAKNISLFLSINELPINLDPARLDDGSGIQETMQKTKHITTIAASFCLITQSFREPKTELMQCQV